MEPKAIRNVEFWFSAIIIILTVFLMFAYYNHWFSFAARVGPFRIIHYIAFAGALYIAFGVILFAALKRRYPNKYKVLLRTHALGNIFAFLLISLHFAGQLGRPADFFPSLGEGLALYIAMVLLVGTGMAFRFRPFRSLTLARSRFLHTGLSFVFYTVIFIHILHGLNII
jgi:hypothetical protein